MKLLPIVEGEGDMEAVPELARRVLHAHDRYDIQVLRPHRRGDLPKVLQRFDDYLQVALIESHPVLWVMDYDCAECSNVDKHTLELKQRATSHPGGDCVEFVFMVREFETLFLADQETTRSVFSDIPANLAFPADAESVRDAKGWLSKARPKGSAYKPTQHQRKLTASVDLARLRSRSESFRRFEAAVLKLTTPQVPHG